ncbi:hypothetical protein [Staphylococcus marylandisciuri]|uniref:hypothetical protein n=1 Tax=Staphylococcus marylandisciuri TaxID=2981529 RepID=UPI0021D3B598|nr:hypothetical protein [Staphylococcus marylandisciuri]
MGPQHRETGKPVSTSTASWGGPIKAKPGAGTGSGTEIFLFKLDFCPAPLIFN